MTIFDAYQAAIEQSKKAKELEDAKEALKKQKLEQMRVCFFAVF